MARSDKSPLPGGTAMLVLALLKGREMYGYQIIEELEKRSSQVFRLQEGTLYPLLHSLERDKLVTAREQETPVAESGGTTASPPRASGPWRRSGSSGPSTPGR